MRVQVYEGPMAYRSESDITGEKFNPGTTQLKVYVNFRRER
jgi:hypothetical protein